MSVEKLDVKGKMCPLPVALTKRKLTEMHSGQLLEVIGEGELEFDNIQRWLKNNEYEILETSKNNNDFRILIVKH
ncbi:MAG: sulfurtransferase TusA family protein [Nitrososphaerota archaeon]|jgi:tRNA 2-thiouridine synthesizing protein A|nr:sulfurtransferase TusA family protein [Nitrososphaerota archaeon]